MLYPFSWQHTFIPVLPASMIDIVCCPTPFLVGLLSSSLPKLKELPVEEVGHLGNPLDGKGGGRNKPPGRKGGEGIGGEKGTGIFSFLTSGTLYLAYSFSLGVLAPAGVIPLT